MCVYGLSQATIANNSGSSGSLSGLDGCSMQFNTLVLTSTIIVPTTWGITATINGDKY
jgi:hypothetical protein